ncbi:hypothetical protein RhiirA1_445454 [Rhizophagus irregularis]|uniref:Alpha/beta hydrolase fold-3 domain-containing protein n=1 Tax=Rhizophagus irregularis TaxID=588596 RepID=A0A2N0R7T5_9GLOM|nr:hypothetical protein RhiirA1_445454 [Rhizophagus irregularis]
MFEFVNNSLLFNISLIIKHYLIGPPKPSWDLKFHQTWAMIKSLSENTSNMTIEQIQSASFRPYPTPAGVMINEFKINNKYRHEAQVHLNKILKPYEHVLDPEWKNLKDDGINAEWVHIPNDGWEKREIRKTILYFHGGAYYLRNKDSSRNFTCSLAKRTNARVLAISYRLAPQNPFPAALHDALAAYLYLLNPPKDTGLEPLNPKNIVIAGISAGGGLSLALGLAIRDAGLPSCAEHPSTTKSYERKSEFINRVINSPNEPLPPSSYNCINVKGEFNHLKEHHKKVLNWEEIGIVPSITRNEFNSTSHRLTPKLLISIGIVSVLAYVLY